MTLLIAEIGINHNGDIKIAKKLIDEAKDAGFDTVKFQKSTIEKVYSKDDLDLPRESPWGKTQRDQKNGLEFNESQYDIIDDYCREREIEWFASAWDVDSLVFLDKYNLKYNKIASAMIVDEPFLEAVAKKKKYTLISTGMSSYADIETAVEIFRKNQCEFELMHCVSTYPCKNEDINLNVINSLKKEFKCKVGYSGHENGIAISLAAYVMGISSLERHITLDRTMYGSDQAASLEAEGINKLTSGIKKIKISLGSDKIGLINNDEILISKKLRKHIVKK